MALRIGCFVNPKYHQYSRDFGLEQLLIFNVMTFVEFYIVVGPQDYLEALLLAIFFQISQFKGQSKMKMISISFEHL